MEHNQQLVLDLLKANKCKLIFTKNDGSKREMLATLNYQYIPPAPETKRTKAVNPDVQPVYDLENNGWRSFRWDSLELVSVI